MCGIAGILLRDSSKSVDRAVLSRMGRTLSHRGPDDFGVYVDGTYGAAHTRLAIIDTSSAGHQPMVTKDKRYSIVFNGEIYNYKQLQDELPDADFVSDSDTEVLLYLLVKKGRTALREVKGMFAFALWDSYARAVLLGRDPFGKKPLYYWSDARSFLFASEVKAFMQYPDFRSDVDISSLTKYFLYEYVPAPASGWRGVREVPMGSCMVVSEERVKKYTWWRPSYTPKRPFGEKEALRTLDKLLAQAVERRLVADVPVGVFLSGGLDSTTIAWYMKQAGAKDFHSCSISFKEPSFDESGYARVAAQLLGIQHHEETMTADDVIRDLPGVVRLLDVPFADASILPTYKVSKCARKFMKVVLDGDGSDELFGGYGTFQAGELSSKLEFVPARLWSVLYELSLKLPVSHSYFSFDFKLKSFLKGMSYPLPKRNQIWLGAFTDRELHRILTPPCNKFIRTVFEDIERIPARSLSPFDAISLLTIMHYMHNEILVKLDRATMMVGLEARTPFLDVDLTNFVMRLPVALKRNKYLLKKLMRGRIPDDIIDRPKKGFGIPIGAWLQGPLCHWMASMLDKKKIQSQGFLQSEEVYHLIEEHRERKMDHRKKLWTLIMFQLWFDTWIVGRK